MAADGRREAFARAAGLLRTGHATPEQLTEARAAVAAGETLARAEQDGQR